MTQENFSQKCSTTIFNLFANNSSIRRICEFYEIILLSAFFLFFSVLRLRSVKRECESRVLRMRGLRRSQARQRVNGRMMARVPTRENKSSSLGKSQGVVDEYTFNLLRVFLAGTYDRAWQLAVVADVSVTRQRIIVNTPGKKKE